MKKVLIADDVKIIFNKEKSFLARDGVRLFNASTTEDVLGLHRAEKVNLIMMGIDMPGMKCEDMCSLIRANQELRAVSMIILCPDNPAALGRGAKCGANVVMTLPVNAALLMEKAQQLLDISSRESYRVLLSVKVEGSSNDNAFFCRSENISTTGILIETDKTLAKGDRVSCAFFLPRSQQLKTTGEIIRVIKQAAGSKSNRYGIKFFQLDDEAKSAIETFVNIKSQISTSKK
jgi:DNA-binding response OmpR family regulator